MPGEDPGSDATIVDTVVIGGGPAGAVAARLLAAWGRSVVLLARAPVRPALAESLPPSCGKLFDRIGIAGDVNDAGFVRTTGNTVRWGGSEARVHRFADGVSGWQVERSIFDRVLLESAARAGAQILSDASVRSVERTAEPAPSSAGVAARAALTRRVVYDTVGRSHAITARWVVDASGRTGIAVPQGWRQLAPAGRTLALIATWRSEGGWGVDDETHTLVESYEDGWAWSVPVATGERTFAFMVAPAAAAAAGRSGVAGLYARETQQTRWFRALLAGAEQTVAPWACDASPYGTARAGEDGLVLAGDAATFVDPLSSYGVKKALASAWLAAIVVNTCLDEPGLAPAALSLHTSRERAMYETLSRQSLALSCEAAEAHTQAFWEDRAAARVGESADGPDVAALRSDPNVLAAFQSLRERASIRLTRAESTTTRELPVVRGNRIAQAEHLIAPAFPEGVRWIRDVDLLTIVRLAADCDQVPDLFDAYNRVAPPVPLPDFLGALSVLLGKGLLRHA
ncbi:MAG: tryptophan 7-halogenase [Gemmatimonadetes bacterium]|nr:tryptophan 7-halogenase [Gemmatimonadota bacterium]